MRRRQKWAQDRAQGFGPGLQRNAVSAEQPQAPMAPPRAGWTAVGEATDWPAPGGAAFTTPQAQYVSVVKDFTVSDPNACPKCGKVLNPRGKHFHVRACRGVAP